MAQFCCLEENIIDRLRLCVESAGIDWFGDGRPRRVLGKCRHIRCGCLLYGLHVESACGGNDLCVASRDSQESSEWDFGCGVRSLARMFSRYCVVREWVMKVKRKWEERKSKRRHQTLSISVEEQKFAEC